MMLVQNNKGKVCLTFPYLEFFLNLVLAHHYTLTISVSCAFALSIFPELPLPLSVTENDLFYFLKCESSLLFLLT